MNSQSAQTFILIGGLLFLSLAVEAKDYQLRLDPPVQVGLKYKLSATATASRSMVLMEGDHIVRTNTEKSDVALESSVTVLEVLSNTKPARERHVIHSLTLSEPHSREELLTNGTIVISLRREGKISFEIDGQPVEPRIHRALSAVAAVGEEGRPTDDDLYGTSDRKKVGDRWNANTELLAKVLADESKPGDFRVKNISGTMTLKQVAEENGVEFLFVDGSVHAKPFVSLPNGFWLKEGNVVVNMTAKFPSNMSFGPCDEAVDFVACIVASGKPRPPDYKDLQLRMTMQRFKSARLVEIK